MSYDPQEKPQDKQSLFGVIIHSFFVVPFLLAVFGVLFFAAVRILTMEKRSIYDYLEDVNNGGTTKRWQAAFELSRQLSAKQPVAQEDRFVQAMIAAFEKSQHDDEKVRQYLALAMARSGNLAFVDPLLQTIDKEKDENLYAIITSLGILKSVKAVDVLLKYLDHDNARIRLATVIALGHIGDVKAIEPLKVKLNDTDVNITWDAAIALAKMGDTTGKGIILKLLDRNYLQQFPEVDPQEQTSIMLVALQVTQNWKDPDIKTISKQLFETDKNMNVRALAQKNL